MIRSFLDESIARGYAKQFLNHYFSERLKAEEFFLDCKLTSLNIKKIYSKYIASTKNFNLNSLLYEKGKWPYFVCSFFEPHEYKDDDYKENIMQPGVFYLATNPEIDEELMFNNYQSFYVSEHAIKRVYQRSGIFITGEPKNYLYMLDELRPIAIWSTIWLTLYNILDKILDSKKLPSNKSPIHHLRPIIPTAHGIFLCDFELNSKTHLKKIDEFKDFNMILRVNSYIGEREFLGKQGALKKRLYEISKPFINSFSAFESIRSYLYPLEQRVQASIERLYLILKTYNFLSDFIEEYNSENNKIISMNTLLNDVFKDSYFLQNIGVFDIKISKGYEAFQKFCMVKKFDADFLLKKIEY